MVLVYLSARAKSFSAYNCVAVVYFQDKSWTEKYLWALFKALSHMLCIGYGRYPPQNIPETCITISSMMTGATFYALFIAYSINVIQTMDSPSRNYKEKVRDVFTARHHHHHHHHHHHYHDHYHHHLYYHDHHHPTSFPGFSPTRPTERERDPGKRWSRVSQNLGDYKQTIWGRGR